MAHSLLRQTRRALVRCVPEDDHLTISLLLRGNAHSLKRNKLEKVEKTLTRISLSDVKARKKDLGKAKKRIGTPGTHVDTPTDFSPPIVKLFDSDEREEVPLDTSNAAAWTEGTWLHVNDQRYHVLINPPLIKTLHVASCPAMVGSPIVPQADIEFADPTLTKWAWWRINKPLNEFTPEFAQLKNASLDTPILATPTISDSECIHTGTIYYPTSQDVGKIVLLQGIPVDPSGRCGHPAYTYTKTISPEPLLYPITQRQLQTPCGLENPQALRVVSYNILADYYSTSEYATKVLFPYCPEYALQPEYRMGVVTREVNGYRPDIVCLQEVSLKWYDNYLLPVFRGRGMDGHMSCKSGKVPEGEATFFNTSKYECIQSHTISIKQYLHDSPHCSELLRELNKAPYVISNASNKHTILQLTLLRSRISRQNDRYILVGNTHLSYHPTEDNIRLIQTIVCMKAIEQVIREFKAGFPLDNQPDVALVFCGDFNSCPCTGGYEFMTKGRVSHAHCTWTQYKYSLIPRCGCCNVIPFNAKYIVNRDRTKDKNTDEGVEHDVLIDELQRDMVPTLLHEDTFNGVDIGHQFNLQDSCGVLPYTNYTVGFKGVLDYIFSDRDLLSVERMIELPDHDMVIENTALPSVVFPSDHLALVCDLKWKI